MHSADREQARDSFVITGVLVKLEGFGIFYIIYWWRIRCSTVLSSAQFAKDDYITVHYTDFL